MVLRRAHVRQLRIYAVWLGLVIVYLLGMLVPLMNYDSAHYATFALRMYEHGDYVNLIDRNVDYLDKPHLLFWTSALAYRLFGVGTFSYKFFSILFTLLGLWSTYKLGSLLHNRLVGRLATLILLTAFGFILANNDVRMDAMLTGSVIFATWQLTACSQNFSWRYLLGSSVGLALGFATKGMIGVAVPVLALGIHLVSMQEWKKLLNPAWLVVPLMFLLLISPVLYRYYLQFDLHPGKVIRGQTGISGVRFILWSQSFERLEGSNFGSSHGNDPFFFLGTFLWSFLPWSVLALISVVSHIRRRILGPREMLTTGTVVVLFIVLSFSGFKLPHYLNILYPFVSISLAAFLFTSRKRSLLLKIQLPILVLLVILTPVANELIFPSIKPYTIAGCLFTLVVGYFLIKDMGSLGKLVYMTSFAAIFANLLFNSHYYPRLLSYQAGKPLAIAAKEMKLPKDRIHYLSGFASSYSFDFHLGHVVDEVSIDELLLSRTPSVIYTDTKGIESLNQQGLSFDTLATHPDYRVSTPKNKFWDAKTRKEVLNHHFLISTSIPESTAEW